MTVEPLSCVYSVRDNEQWPNYMRGLYGVFVSRGFGPPGKGLYVPLSDYNKLLVTRTTREAAEKEAGRLRQLLQKVLVVEML